jgi:hypothetical protein
MHSEKRGAPALRVLLGLVALSAFVGGSLLLRKHEELDIVHVLEAGAKSERMAALVRVQDEPKLWGEIEGCSRPPDRGRGEVCPAPRHDRGTKGSGACRRSTACSRT